jgi:KDO2-lipid IV(A) lauroyltransferase
VAAHSSPRSAPIRTAQQLAAVFEQTIKEHPEDWHMLQRVFVADLDRERLKSTRNGTADANPDAKADP